MSPAIKSLLVLIGLATAIVALLGLLRGSVYCKSGPYSRSTQPPAFCASIGVYLMWSALMECAAFFMHD
jgi:multisubunit Na+/H+ antiporter MnhG subunit